MIKCENLPGGLGIVTRADGIDEGICAGGLEDHLVVVRVPDAASGIS